ncbi:hypothetical protein EON63_03995 [archaeon]|nr:MAG: hypothetical protein EON63_03995 [archaeon]
MNLRSKVVQHTNGTTYYINKLMQKVQFNNTCIRMHYRYYDNNDMVHLPDRIIEQLVTVHSTLPTVVSTGLTNQPTCPCTPPTSGYKRISTTHLPITACFLSTSALLDSGLLSTPTIHYKVLKDLQHIHRSNCSMYVEWIDKLDDILNKHLCPERCMPIPIVRIAWSMVEYFVAILQSITLTHTHTQDNVLLSHDYPITCTLTWSQVLLWHYNLPTHKQHEYSHMPTQNLYGMFFTLLYSQRIKECKEEFLWSYYMPSEHMYNLPKRYVQAVILSVGTIDNMSLLRDQLSILAHQLFTASYINSWMATEDVYPCTQLHKHTHTRTSHTRTHTCAARKCNITCTDHHYYPYMPRTNMHKASQGWRCAQARMTRGLTHLLHLFDSLYVLVVDDDTYISKYVLFSKKFYAWMLEYVVHKNVAVGALLPADGDITPQGFFFGGGGLILSNTTLHILQSRVIKGPSKKTIGMYGEGMSRHLSVLYEAYDNALSSCSEECITGVYHTKSNSTYSISGMANGIHNQLGVYAASKVTLMEICRNLYAHPYSCYHSDHALSRCLTHGAYARFIDAPCMVDKKLQLELQSDTSNNTALIPFGMCYYYYPCTPRYHLTCHRWRVDRLNHTHAISLVDKDKLHVS